MARQLTKKQKGFVKDYIKTGNGVQSALKNYDVATYETAGVIATENLEKPKIIQAIQDAFPNELLAKVHLEGLNASRELVKDGEVLVSIPDFAVRHKYLDSAYKLKGLYADDKPLPPPQLNVMINLGDGEKIRQEYEQKLKDSLLA